MRVVVVLGLLTACGRIGFDPLTASDGSTTIDGSPPPTDLEHVRSALFDSQCATLVFSADSITMGPDGNVYIGGCASGAGSFGSFAYNEAAPETGYLAGFDPDLVPIQVRVFPASQGTAGVFEVDSDENSIYASGLFDTGIDIGSGVLATLGADDIFAGRYAPGTLAHLLSDTYGSSADDDQGYGFAYLGDGAIVVGGGCNGSFSFGGAALVGADNDPCYGVIRGGNQLFAQRWQSANTGGMFSIAVLSITELALAGYYATEAPFPGLAAGGMADGFVARVATDGTLRWAAGIVGTGDDAAVEVEVEDTGDVYAMGHANSAVTIAGRAMPFAGVYDGWIARFDPSGTLVWATMIAGAGDDDVRNAAIVGDTVIIAGNFSGTILIGGDDLVSNGGSDIFVAALSREDGTVRWAKSFGGAGVDRVRSMIRDGDRYYLTGVATPPVDFGGGTLTGTRTGVFLLALAPP